MSVPRPARDGGFTLVELLVSLTVLALMMTLAFGSVRLGARVWESDARQAAQRRVHVAEERLRDWLVRAEPYPGPVVGSSATVLFSGGPSGVSFLVSEIGREGATGLTRVSVFLAPDPEDSSRDALYAMRAPWTPDGRWPPALDPRAARPLLDGLEDAAFAYYGSGPEAAPTSWRPTWIERDRLPALVALTAVTSDPRAADLALAVAPVRAPD